MLKIKDRVILGIVSGILAGTPDTILNAIEYRMGLTDQKYARMGAKIFLPRKKTGSFYGQATGYLANYTMIGGAGVLFTYFLAFTGKKNAFIKGIGFGAASWLAVYGLGSRLTLSVRRKKPQTPLLSFFDHLLFGGLLGIITPGLAHESVFPEGSIKKDVEPVPLNWEDNNEGGAN